MNATRYTVYREYVSGRDGDKGFDDLTHAERDFEDAIADADVYRAELIDNASGAPVVLRRHGSK